MLLCILLRAYVISYGISFSPSFLLESANAILITDIICILDILFNFNTGFYFKGFLITDRAAIVRNYLRQKFLIDFLGSIPFQLSIDKHVLFDSGELYGINSFRYILLVKFFHFYRIKSIFYQLEDKFTSIHSVTAIKFFHFSVLLSLMIH